LTKKDAKSDAKSDQKQHHNTIYLIENNGEPGGARTRDHRIKSAMLYQLSYRLLGVMKTEGAACLYKSG
jgi:hypothetical protein